MTVPLTGFLNHMECSEMVRRGGTATDIDMKQALTDTAPSPATLLSPSRVVKRRAKGGETVRTLGRAESNKSASWRCGMLYSASIHESYIRERRGSKLCVNKEMLTLDVRLSSLRFKAILFPLHDWCMRGRGLRHQIDDQNSPEKGPFSPMSRLVLQRSWFC